MVIGFIWVACAFICAGLAQNKKRNILLWGGLGVLFGFFSVIAIACLPALP